MTSNIHTLYPRSLDGNANIGTVTDVQDYQATMVNLGGALCQVAGHLSGVDALRTGDRVLTFQTDDGLIVVGRLLAEDEAPAPRLESRDGHLVLEASRSIRLQAGEHRIEVHADGHIELDGRRITGHAEDCVQLSGAAIELN